MDDKQAKRLGSFLRKQREAKGLSQRQLATDCDLPHTTIARIEEGRFAAPSPAKLSRITEVLGLALADVYALAEYASPADLPSPRLYLRTKYRDLPASQMAAVSREIEAVLKRHGIDPQRGPSKGQDETTSSPRPGKKKSQTKKGGM